MSVRRFVATAALLGSLVNIACGDDKSSAQRDTDAGATPPIGGGLPIAGGEPPTGGATGGAEPPAGGAPAPADPAAIDAFWSEIFTAVCSKGATCCPNEPNYAPGGLCSILSTGVSNGSKEDVAGGYARFVPGATAACVTATRALLDAAGCDTDIFSLLAEFGALEACTAVLVPDQREGEPCTKDLGQCVAGLVCAKNAEGTARCAPPAAIGGACVPGESSTGCAPTDECDAASSTCVTRSSGAPGGAPCDGPEMCESGDCQAGVCADAMTVGLCGN